MLMLSCDLLGTLLAAFNALTLLILTQAGSVITSTLQMRHREIHELQGHTTSK